jgi:tripartite ATP-independent transporter DctM subunit
MSPLEIGLLGLALLIVLFFSRMPVAYAMALVGFGGFCWLRGLEPGLNLLAQDIYKAFSAQGLTVIPLFVLMGQFAFRGGISRRLYEAAYRFTGALPGGLAMATVCACSAFGAVCGSSPATAATMATVGLPEMRRRGYHPRLAAGCVTAGGAMGMLVPPSVVLIVYGMLTQQSIGRLFVAGVVPALVITALFVLTAAAICLRNPELGPPGQRFGLGEKIASLGGLFDALGIFILIMAGLCWGWFTPSEAGGVGALGVLTAALLRRRLDWKGILRALVDTVQTSCMVLFLITGAVIFGHFLAVTGMPMALAGAIGGLDLPGWAVMLLMVLVYLIGGCVIDAMALIMLTIPIFLPIVLNLGLDPIWFGVIIVLVTQMGVITPPVGINAYVVNGVDPSIPLEEIFRGCLPFLGALTIGATIMVFWPRIVLWLPDLMYGQ